MVLVMDDVQHLQLIKSPFTPLALLKKLDPTIVRWLGSKFPVTVSSPVKSLHDEQSFWQYLARQLLTNSTALVLRGGDRLAETGDIGDEAFVLLSGNVEIPDRRGAILTRVEKGVIIGEIAYLAATPRTANMAGAQDAEVLVLTQETLKKHAN